MNGNYTNINDKISNYNTLVEPWHIPDTLYDTLCNCFKIKRVIHCSPMTLPLRAKEYISHDPQDATFGALPYTKTAWPDASLALPSYKAGHLTTTLGQALNSAHAHRHTQPNNHMLILPNWQHSPYLARDLHSSYAQSSPRSHTYNPTTHRSTSITQNSKSTLSLMKRLSDL